MTGINAKFMKRALTLARKGIGKTAPNPAVGCVIVKDGKIIGEGWHKKAGEKHAEIHALDRAGDLARGADVYITLEPCCHTGKTPPCSEALIRAGVKRVIAGMDDPNPRVNGGGLRNLEQAGIITVRNLLEEECRAINRPFIKHVTTGFPYVTYKCAMTLDGKIAAATGESRWISGEESRKYVHQLRSRCDAIMVGVNTIIADDPQLTVRHVKGKNPLRIIVDSHLRTPTNVAALNSVLTEKTVIATVETDPALHRRYEQCGATIVICKEQDGRVDMKDMLKQLGEQGIQSIMMEGGARLAGEALKHGLIDECLFFYAPKVIGSDGISPFAITGVASMANAIHFKDINVKRMGSDIVVSAHPEKPCLQA